MHGIGNDFMVIDGITQPFRLTPSQIKQLAHRNFGIGFDQLLLVETSTIADFKYRIFNADGGEVSQCGNGARCFVRFLHEKKLTEKTEITVETASGVIMLTLQTDGLVKVNMGAPKFAPNEIPFLADKIKSTYTLELGDAEQNRVVISTVSMGNPHAVQFVQDIELAPVATFGPLIEAHLQFPERVNAGFVEVVDKHHIKLRVFERGSGETLACGTGACAAAVAGIRLGLLANPVKVTMRGGELSIDWPIKANRNNDDVVVTMTGPAVMLFDGQIEI